MDMFCGNICSSREAIPEWLLTVDCVLTEDGSWDSSDRGVLTDSGGLPSTGWGSTEDLILIGGSSLSASGGTPSGSGGPPPTSRSVKLGRLQSALGARVSRSKATSSSFPVSVARRLLGC